MRKLYLLFALVFFSGVYGQEPFITRWEVTQFGAKSITIPIVPGPGVNYTVDFGDGVILTNQTGQCTHTYPDIGEYIVTISGSFNRIHFGSLPNAIGDQTGQIETIKLKSILQWGDTQWSTMEGAFENCANLGYIEATDTPDLSQVTSMKRMFRLCLIFEPEWFSNINDWDVSNVTSMEETFGACRYFNSQLANWDVSNVTNFRGMFMEAVDFNQPLSTWDVSNATDMSNMFRGAESFNQPLNNWNVSNVTNMSSMFDGTGSFSEHKFNQPLNNWDVSNVIDMRNMFNKGTFNQPLNNWDVSSVTNMSGMFSYSEAFNQPLSNWDVSNVTDMSLMFMSSEAFNQSLADWDVSGVTTMYKTFRGSKVFNQPLNDWDVSSVTDVREMFYSALAFNQPLDNWDISGVTSLDNMFYKASVFNGSVNGWDVSNVTSLKSTFSEAASFNQALNDWDVSGVLNAEFMFRGAVAFNQDLSDWELSYCRVNGMFQNAANFNQDLSGWDFSNIYLSSSISSRTFIADSGLDTENYDALLLRFAQLEIDGGIDSFVVSGLEYCNIALRQYLIEELEWSFAGDSLGENCPGNTISGTVLFDENGNGCDAADVVVPNFLIRANDETYDYAASTSATGGYEIKVMEDTYTTTLLNVPSYFTVSPQQQVVTFTGFGNEEEINFCLTANQQVNDLNVTLIPVNEARPGFASQYQLIAQNLGTQTVANATLTLEYDDAIQSFTNAVPAATSATAGQLSFSLANLQPFESRTMTITMQTFTPPTVNGGEVIDFTATVTPDADDYTVADNTFAYAQTVVNSYDPNDKQVLQGDEIFIEQAQGYLDYLVRFQNTGTASAITVRIEDHLPENVDWTTLRPVSASHNYRIELKDEHTVEFIFDNINLPHEAANEPASHGFIAYKIKPLPTVALGDVITGNAEIFFDYNLPIITNFATTTVIEAMYVAEHTANTVSIYPNPVTDVLHLNASNGSAIEEAKVFNLQGRELLSFAKADSINVENLSSGVYVLLVKTASGVSKHKLVRK